MVSYLGWGMYNLGHSGGAVWSSLVVLGGVITRRSRVQIPPPLLNKKGVGICGPDPSVIYR